MNAKIINWLLGIFIVLRCPLFAYIYILFEPDANFIQVMEFYSSILYVLFVVFIIALFIKIGVSTVKWLLLILWLLFELTYLSHTIISLFTTDQFNTYLITLGLAIIPLTVYQLSKDSPNVCSILK